MYFLDSVLQIIDDVKVVGILVVDVLKVVIFVVKIDIYRINLMCFNLKFDLELVNEGNEKYLFERYIYLLEDMLRIFEEVKKVGIFVI